MEKVVMVVLSLLVFPLVAVLFLLIWRSFLPTPDWLRKFSCWMSWHSPLDQFCFTGFDGCSTHAQCSWCGYQGMIDSQGNLF